MLFVDYRGARTVLRERRFELRMRLRDLADKAGVSRITIYHLEKIENEPDHEPKFETMEKLAAAMGLTRQDFFARIESLHAHPPVSTVRATPAETPHGTAPVVSLDDIGSLIARNTDTLVRLVAAVERIATAVSAREQVATARNPRPPHAPRHRATGRSAAR